MIDKTLFRTREKNSMYVFLCHFYIHHPGGHPLLIYFNFQILIVSQKICIKCHIFVLCTIIFKFQLCLMNLLVLQYK